MEEQLFDSNFFEQLNTFQIVMKQKNRLGMSGQRKSSAKGSSVEFSDFREYMLGDDIRKIDWNAYGRMDKLFVKLFMEEKEGVFHVLSDCSKSMDYGQLNKSVTARRIAAAFSYMVLHNMDRLYLGSIQDKAVKISKPMTGQQSFHKVMNIMEEYLYNGETHLTEAIKKLPFHGKGMTIILSDFYEYGGMEELMKYLTYEKQEVMLIQVLAKEEVNIEAEGLVKIIDSETNQEEKVTISTKVLKEYHNKLEQFQKELKYIAKKYQASFIQVEAGEELKNVIYSGILSGKWHQK